MFCDEVTVKFHAGKGGDGLVSWRRERYIAKRGPDGGDGGKGADVLIIGNANINSLYEYNLKKQFFAENGVSGGNQNKRGRQGVPLELFVPLGTKLYNAETGDLIADITKHNQACVIAEGGRGGYGNAHFVSSVRQAPNFAELGEPGQEIEVRMELEMIADIGIIGYPSAGKSTLISRITEAKPKIGEYHFTTLVPNLGVVTMSKFGGAQNEAFAVADIPGLIEGAHEGKGLGDQFLKHIKRTAATIHLIDLTLDDFIEKYEVINHELEMFDKGLSDSKQFVVFNKIDAISEDEIELKMEFFYEKFPELKGKCYFISGVSGEGLERLVWDVYEWTKDADGELVEEAEDFEVEEGYRVFRPHLEDEKTITVEKVEPETHIDRFTNEEYEAQVFMVSGKRLNQIVVMTDAQNREARDRVYDVMHKMGVNKLLKKEKIEVGDIVRIAGKDFVYRGE